MEYIQIPVGRAKDLTGKRFGFYTVLYRTENKNNQPCWVCRCDCGTTKPVRSQYLTKAKEPSCGCQNRQKSRERMAKYNEQQRNLKIGDVVGNLTIIDYIGLRKQKSRDKNESWYLCKCSCGNIKEIRGNDLQQQSIKSCGCISSLGERTIETILKEHSINYKKEFTFKDLTNPKTGRRLRFDFCIFNSSEEIDFLVEFDGRQHISGPEAKWSNSSSLEDIKFKDNLKDEYCKNKGITLKRIPYYCLSKLNYQTLYGNDFIIQN